MSEQASTQEDPFADLKDSDLIGLLSDSDQEKVTQRDFNGKDESKVDDDDDE